jgi:Rrf2 family protein
MKLSTRSRYGLRLMFELARDGNGGPVLLKDIARRQNISEKYLSRLVIPLRAARLVRSVRGFHGGYMLARSPRSITVKEIVETLDGELASFECAKETMGKLNAVDYALRAFWCRLDEAIAGVLATNTLETLVDEYLEARRAEALTFDI